MRLRQLSVCAGPSGARPQTTSDFSQGTVIGGRYEVDTVLGRGGNGVTYRCTDSDTGRLVAVKALSLRSLRDWKQLELFQREAQILENLDHPGIPQYIDAFEEDTAADRAFFLVQELAAGESLEDMVERGWRADESEITRIATELLGILQYLSTRRPAVVHRDIKPSNIVIEGGRTGGRVFLVDFGGVQAAAAAGEMPSSTVVGTYGFMAPEQFRGAARPASDLYGLGATLLYLLSGRPPSAFPVDRMRLDLSSVEMGPRLEAVVEGLLEPVVEDRLGADAALAILSGRRPARSGGSVGGRAFSGGQPQQQRPREQEYVPPRGMGAGKALLRRKPPGSRIRVVKKGPKLEIDIPPARFDGSTAATGAFALAWNAFVAFWTISALAGGGILFALFSLPFWFAGAQLVKQTFGRQFVRERLEIGLGRWKLQTQLAGLSSGAGGNSEVDWSKGGGKSSGGRTDDLVGATMSVLGYINGVPQTQLVLKQGIESFALAEGLDPLEQEWLAEVINTHLTETAELRGELGAFVDDSDDDEEEVQDGVLGSSAGVSYREFADFDKRLGAEVDAAKRAGAEAAERAQRAAQAAREDAQRQADRAVREAKRASGRGRRPLDPESTIELDSGDFDVLD